MSNDPDNEPKPGTFGAMWRALRRPSQKYTLGGLLVFGIFAGIMLWGAFNTAMEMTNTESFCIGCHEMKDNVYEEYKQTIHYNNRTGVRATCPDCHVPKEWVYKFIRKIRASNELYHKVLGTIDTREKFETKRLQMARNVWKTMKSNDSRECRNCHAFDYMDFTKQERRSKKRHEKALKKGSTCIDCHQGVAHELPEGWDEEEEET